MSDNEAQPQAIGPADPATTAMLTGFVAFLSQVQVRNVHLIEGGKVVLIDTSFTPMRIARAAYDLIQADAGLPANPTSGEA